MILYFLSVLTFCSFDYCLHDDDFKSKSVLKAINYNQ